MWKKTDEEPSLAAENVGKKSGPSPSPVGATIAV